MSATRIAKLSRTFLAGAVLLITTGLPLFVTQARAETVKGRFEGIQGGGSFTGKVFPEVGGYDDFTGTYTLPEK